MDATERGSASHHEERQPSRHARLIGALRLIFDERDALELATLTRDSIEFTSLQRLLRAARRRYRVRAGGPFRRDHGVSHLDDRPLPPTRALPADAALALALHAGDGRELTEVADLLDQPVDSIARAVDRARYFVEPALPPLCGAQPTLIPRFHDTGLEADERIALFTHLRSCAACARYVDVARLLDGELAFEAARLAREPDARAAAPRGDRMAVAGRVAAGVAGIVVLLLALAGLRALLTDEGERVPALGAQPPPVASGWLVLLEGDKLAALNLATGETRTIVASSNESTMGSYLSPDGQRVASAYWSFSPGARISVEVTRVLDGSVSAFEWDSTDEARYLTGWLNNRELVAIVYPTMRPGELQIEYQARAMRDMRVIAVDAGDARERVLLSGAPGPGYVYPSPDGTRVLLLRASDAMVPEYGITAELRPVVDGQIGEPIATIDRRMVPEGNYRWAPDSSAVVLVAFDADIPDSALTWRGDSTAMNELPASLVVVTRDGTIEPLVARPEGMGMSVAGVGPGARQIAYETWSLAASGSGRVEGGTLALVDRASGTTTTLSAWEDAWSLGHNVVWSPDGSQYVALISQPSYFPLADEDPFGDAALRALTVWTAGQPTTLSASFASTAPGISAWLPADAFPERTQRYLDDPDFGGFDWVVGVRPDSQMLDQWSSVSPDGASVTLSEHRPDVPVVFRSAGDTVRRLSKRARDVAWLPDSNSLIGVYASDPEDELGRRLMVYTLMEGIPTEAFDYRVHDPAGLGDTPGAGYAAPRVAPDGLHASVFVRDSASRSLTLWLAGNDLPPREVLRWTRPNDALVDPALIAYWLSPTTLLIVEPVDWQHGLPRAARIHRVTVTEGNVELETLRTVDGRGDDRGVTIEELLPSPDGKELAWRLRHYREYANDRGRADSLVVAPVSDISQETELARGLPGYGMTWLDDGRWLVAGLEGRLIAADTDQLETRWLTPEGDDARWPLRVGDALWVSLDSGTGARIVSASVADSE